jgi:RNA polymerase subunit RPABC4/transcription elongation factor Spt4
MKSILEINGIKCDCCDYKDSDVGIQDYNKWLNKSCPICGSNLLTQADYEMVKKLVVLVDTQNSNIALNNIDEPIITATLSMNGSGNLKIENLALTI